MPYKIDPNNKKCVVKADTGKKVGCTKGSVKKYLTALRMHVHESDDLEWAQDVVDTTSIDITNDKSKILSLEKGDVITITGEYEGLSFDNEKATIIELSGESPLLKFDNFIDDGVDNSHCGEAGQHDICECQSNGVVGKCWYTNLTEMENVIWHLYEKGKTLNESEDDLAWAEDTVNTNPTYRFRDLVFKPHRLPDAVQARLNFPNGHYISVVGGPHMYGDGVDTFEIWGSDTSEPEGYLTKADVTNRMFELQNLPPLEGEGSFKIGPITESEENDFEWVEDTFKNMPLVSLTYLDPYTDSEISVEDSNLSDWINGITDWNNSHQSGGGTKIYKMIGSVTPKYRILFYIERGGYVEISKNISYYTNDLTTNEPHLELSTAWPDNVGTWDAVQRFLLSLQVRIPITESEENDLEWAQDAINGFDEYKEYDSEMELSRDTFLIFTGRWDQMKFDNQEAKVVRKGYSDTYLLVFPEVLDQPTGGTHCGDDAQDEYDCHCEDNDSERGRCWFVDLNEMRDVKIFPNRKGFLNENKEWYEDVVDETPESIMAKDLEVGDEVSFHHVNYDSQLINSTGQQIRNEKWHKGVVVGKTPIPKGEWAINHLGLRTPTFIPHEGTHNGEYGMVIRTLDGSNPYGELISRNGNIRFNTASDLGEKLRFKLLKKVNVSDPKNYFMKESKNKKPLLTEGRYDAITRKAVKDIMQVVTETRGKNDDLHQAVLPWDIHNVEEYEQEGLSFYVELNVHHQSLLDRGATNESEAYYVNSAASDDDENVIMMTIVVDPLWEPKIYEKLFYKLQEDIRHEIEHFTQSGYNRIEDRPVSTTNTANLKTVFGHHKHKLEVPALVHGFYRRAKLEKRPLDEVMIEDLDSEIQKGNLTKKQAETLLKMWVEYAKKNLPRALYSKE